MTSLAEQWKGSISKTKEFFLSNYGSTLPVDEESQAAKIAFKLEQEYGHVKNQQPAAAQPDAGAAQSETKEERQTKRQKTDELDAPIKEKQIKLPGLVKDVAGTLSENSKSIESVVEATTRKSEEKASTSTALVDITKAGPGRALILKHRQQQRYTKPVWHAPWELMRVIPGHLGWVRSIAVDPANEWFCTGAADRTIKIWDLASGKLKLTLTGHISAVTGLAVSARHPYLFSVGQDKLVKCWDLEQNKVIRSYHGHLSGVKAVALHPTLDVLVTGGRDSAARVWDMRTKTEIRVLGGHIDAIADIICSGTDPQVITGSHDKTVRLWDLAAGKTITTLTNHKKSVRALVSHPTQYSFASGSADNIKVWKLPEGKFLRNHTGHDAIINTLCMNRDNVLVSGGDNGSLQFWDWNSGYSFQQIQSKGQSGSLDAEAGIFKACFDMTGSRLLTAEADKTIKVWKEDPNATPETHPIDFKPPRKRKRY